MPWYASVHGGLVLSATIDKYLYITLNQRSVDHLIRVSHGETELVDTVGGVRHELTREVLGLAENAKGLDVYSSSDVPGGTGLGSSGAFAVGLLRALRCLARRPAPPEDLAEEACKVEIDVLEKPVGKQDQYLAAFGGVRRLEIGRNNRVSVSSPKITPETLKELETNTLLFYTGIHRSSAGVLGEQSEVAEKSDGRSAEHLHRIKEIGRQVEVELEKGDARCFGHLMHDHWIAKRELSPGVSSDALDRWYAIGMNNGALGGKLIGAGGGGFLMFYCEEGKQHLRHALAQERLLEMPFRFERQGSQILLDSR